MSIKRNLFSQCLSFPWCLPCQSRFHVSGAFYMFSLVLNPQNPEEGSQQISVNNCTFSFVLLVWSSHGGKLKLTELPEHLLCIEDHWLF